MGLMTHELIVRDKGLPTIRVALRTGCPEPIHPLQVGDMSEILYYEDPLPPDMSEFLIELISAHTDQLARSIGDRWMNHER
jgi:hypothetical protein